MNWTRRLYYKRLRGPLDTQFRNHRSGDIIKRDDPICDIRTDLVTFGMITDDEDSIMSEILVPEESEPVDPGTVLCITLSKECASEGVKDEAP